MSTIHPTTTTPPEWCWLWHSEDKEWFWPRHGTSRLDFANVAYDHITHWAEAHQRPFPDTATMPTKAPTPSDQSEQQQLMRALTADLQDCQRENAKLREATAGWTVKESDYNRLAAAARELRTACKDRLPPGHYAKLDEECRAIDAILAHP